MIINLPNRLELKTDKANKIIALENIIKSHGEGKHHVWIPARVIKELMILEEFGHFTKRTLDALMSQSTENAYLYKEFDFYVTVNFEEKYSITYKDSVLDVGYLNFINTTSTQESVLLTENELDGEAYFWGAKTFLQIKNLHSLKINIEIAQGGGSTTFNYFNRLNSGLRFFACYVDSDKSHPKWPLGSTAARFDRTPKGYDRRRYLEILTCHEIENIIPRRVLNEISSEKVSESLILEPRNLGYRAYPDHKTGLSVKEALAADRAHHENYWSDFKDLDSDTALCAAFGESLLKDSVKYIMKLSPKSSKEHVDEDIDSEWIRISKIIASWGVSSRGILS